MNPNRPSVSSHRSDGSRASSTGPAGQILRANPFSEGTDLSCRLPLSTFVYRPEAINLGDLMRSLVRADLKTVTTEGSGVSLRPEQVQRLVFSRIGRSARDATES